MSYNNIDEKLKLEEMHDLYENIELPLIGVLYDMEKYGIKVNPNSLKEYSEKLSVRIKELEDLIYKEAGCEFNINSPKQLGEILFEKMGL